MVQAERTRVLIVDDDPIILAVVERILEPEYEVVGVGTALEAMSVRDLVGMLGARASA